MQLSVFSLHLYNPEKEMLHKWILQYITVGQISTCSHLQKPCKSGATFWDPKWKLVADELGFSLASSFHITNAIESILLITVIVLIIIKAITVLSWCVSLNWAVSPLTKGSRSYDHHQPPLCCTVCTFGSHDEKQKDHTLKHLPKWKYLCQWQD